MSHCGEVDKPLSLETIASQVWRMRLSCGPISIWAVNVMLNTNTLTYSRVRRGLKSTWIYRTVLKSPWKLNLPWKVLDKHSKALKSPWILPFTGGFNTVFEELNQYKNVVPLFGAAYAAPNKGTTIYTNFLKLKSLVMDSFMCSLSHTISISIKFSITYIMFMYLRWHFIWVHIRLKNVWILLIFNVYTVHISLKLQWEKPMNIVYICSTVNVLNFQTLIACQKGLDKSTDPEFAILTSILWLATMITNILFEIRKSKVFKILENLLYAHLSPVLVYIHSRHFIH